jgi:preprotein translocase subunit SecF
VELLKEVSIDWLGKKWYFFCFSGLLLAVGVIGYFVRGGLAWGIDFTGGTIIIVKFNHTPDLDLIRESLKSESATPPLIQTYDVAAKNTVLVRMQSVLGSGQETESGNKDLQNLLRKAFDPQNAESQKMDFNNVGLDALNKYLLGADPDNLKSQNKTTQETDAYYANLAQSMMEFRNKTCEGLVNSLDDLKGVSGVTSAAFVEISKSFYAGPFAIKATERVGAIVGSDLRRRAQLAVGLSFLGMLIYIGIRFKPIYGVSAILAVMHDTAITVGLFAITQKEISLTVIAALLTLIGYSLNDTIVIFDRVRENLRSARKESLYQTINLSINQTLARTIITSATVFLSVLSLYLFGGEVLNGFSFALTFGVIIGSYSTIALAGPVVEWWYRYTDQKSKRKSA